MVTAAMEALARDLNVLPCKTGILNGTNTHLLCIRVDVYIYCNTLFMGLDDRMTHTDVAALSIIQQQQLRRRCRKKFGYIILKSLPPITLSQSVSQTDSQPII